MQKFVRAVVYAFGLGIVASPLLISSWRGQTIYGSMTIRSQTRLPPQLRGASVALRRYSLGGTPRTGLKALLNYASES
jgi:hypothetical protein